MWEGDDERPKGTSMTENPGPNPFGPPSDGSQGQNPTDPYAQGQNPTDPYAQGGYGQPGHQQSADPYQQTNPGPSQQGYDPYAQQHAAYGQQPGGGNAFAAQAQTHGKNFFAALFDFSFSTFVTPKIIKIVYIILTVIIGLGLLFFLLTSLISGDALAIIGALIIGPIVALFYLAIMRMSLEMYYAVIRLSEDVHQRLPRQ